MAITKTPFLQLVSVNNAQDANDALTNLASIKVPKSGTIMSCSIIDLGKQSANLDVYLSQATFTATTIDAAFDPSDTDILNCVGLILVDTWKAFNDSSLGIVDNVGLPYYAPEYLLYLQLITRGTPTPAGTNDYSISLGIVH